MKHKLPVLLPYIFLGVLTLCACWLFAGRYGVFGAKVDWISQHSVLPEYFRQQFYQTGELFPEFAPWKADLIDDLLRFPGATYKETVDATVQAILYLMSKPTSSIGGGDMSKDSYWRR